MYSRMAVLHVHAHVVAGVCDCYRQPHQKPRRQSGPAGMLSALTAHNMLCCCNCSLLPIPNDVLLLPHQGFVMPSCCLMSVAASTAARTAMAPPLEWPGQGWVGKRE